MRTSRVSSQVEIAGRREGARDRQLASGAALLFDLPPALSFIPYSLQRLLLLTDSRISRPLPLRPPFSSKQRTELKSKLPITAVTSLPLSRSPLCPSFFPSFVIPFDPFLPGRFSSRDRLKLEYSSRVRICFLNCLPRARTCELKFQRYLPRSVSFFFLFFFSSSLSRSGENVIYRRFAAP